MSYLLHHMVSKQAWIVGLSVDAFKYCLCRCRTSGLGVTTVTREVTSLRRWSHERGVVWPHGSLPLRGGRLESVRHRTTGSEPHGSMRDLLMRTSTPTIHQHLHISIFFVRLFWPIGSCIELSPIRTRPRVGALPHL
jgi:hypothetical protein